MWPTRSSQWKNCCLVGLILGRRRLNICVGQTQGFLDDLENQGIRWAEPRKLNDSLCFGEIISSDSGHAKFYLNFWPVSSDSSRRLFAVVSDLGRDAERKASFQLLSCIKETAFRHGAVVGSADDAGKQPLVVFWFRAYCFVAAIGGLIFLSFFLTFQPGAGQHNYLTAQDAPFAAIAILVLVVPFLVGMFVPRKKWGWFLGLILICFGATLFPYTLVPVVPLFIFWFKARTRSYFSGNAS